MRIGYKIFKQIKKWYGSDDFQIGNDDYFTKGRVYSVCTGITLRFGYWQKVDLDGLKKILPDWCNITENTMDDDDDCGTLYNYNITDSSKYYPHNQVD